MQQIQFHYSAQQAIQLDQQDPLSTFRQQFLIPPHEQGEQAYFLGNSLGLQPVDTASQIQEVMEQWRRHGVESFFVGSNPWLQYHDQLTGPLSAIVGAQPEEVVVMNQLTVNLHLMLVSFYRPQGKRRKILCEAKAFPSDQYMLETHVKHHGFDPSEVVIEVKPREGEYTLRTEDILAAIQQHREELALVLFSGINYYTGQLFDIPSITAAAHEACAFAGFDLAHAAGNVELKLHEWEVDFACWCSYKYLNSGPGAVGGAFIHKRFHQKTELNRFAGWWGYDKATRFAMEAGFKPIPSAEGWQLSTPPLLLYAAHKAALNLFARAGMEALHEKRRLLNGWLWFVLETINNGYSDPPLKLLTPADPSARGCQVSLLVKKEGKAIHARLMERGFVTDWREPDVIRLAPVPLYNTYSEVFRFGEALKEILG